MKNVWKYGIATIIGLLVGMIVGIFMGIFIFSKMVTPFVEKNEPYIETSAEVEDVGLEVTLEKDESKKEDLVEVKKEQELVVDENNAPGENLYVEGEYELWTEETVYLKDDMAQYNDKIYKAKWWIQGEFPDTSEAWEVTDLEPGKLLTLSDLLEKQSVSVENQTAMLDTDFKVVAYYPSWKPDELDKIDYSVMTHIIYSFAIPTKDGTLMPLENPELAKFIVEEAHANKRKALLAIGGWSYNDVPLEATFMEATNSQEKIEKFGDSIIEMCNTYGFDGIDMDWEHPRFDGISVNQYETLMLYLSEKLHGQGKILTSAVLSGMTPWGNELYDAKAHTDTVLDAVDWINVMAYDGGDGGHRSKYDFAVDCGRYWNVTRGLEASKVVLGVPFYANPSWASYEELLASNSKTYECDKIQYKGMQAYYNGIDTIEDKTEYAKENLGGIMIWEVTQDTDQKEYSLLEAIKEELED